MATVLPGDLLNPFTDLVNFKQSRKIQDLHRRGVPINEISERLRINPDRVADFCGDHVSVEAQKRQALLELQVAHEQEAKRRARADAEMERLKGEAKVFGASDAEANPDAIIEAEAARKQAERDALAAEHEAAEATQKKAEKSNG